MSTENTTYLNIITRPNASPGFWLCFLIPMSFLVSSLRYPYGSASFDYKLITFTAQGLNLQSATFFIYISTNCSTPMRFIYAFLPGFATAMLYHIGLSQTVVASGFWGFLMPLLYQFIYITVMKKLPRCFTFGEASVIVQGFVLFLQNAIIKIPGYIKYNPRTDLGEMRAIMLAGLLCLTIAVIAVYLIKPLRNAFIFYPFMAVVVSVMCAMPITRKLPVVTLYKFLTKYPGRIFLLIFYFGLVGLMTATVMYQINKSTKALTRVRKIFHILVTCAFIPGLIYQCPLLYISTAIFLSLLIILELLRLLQIPPFSEAIKSTVNIFCDDKDAGPVVLTPFYLLIGCALPMWITVIPCSYTDVAGHNLIPLLSGVISVGIGDSVASVIGSKFGKHKWPSTIKSIEGTLASIIAQSLTIYGFWYAGYTTFNYQQTCTVGAAILITSLLEAFTDQVDNLVLPLVFFIVTCLT